MQPEPDSDAETPFSGDLIEWAEVIFAMEKSHKAVQPVTFEEIKEADQKYNANYHPAPSIEYKSENWGKLRNKIICLDYGIDDIETITKKRKCYENNIS